MEERGKKPLTPELIKNGLNLLPALGVSVHFFFHVFSRITFYSREKFVFVPSTLSGLNKQTIIINNLKVACYDSLRVVQWVLFSSALKETTLAFQKQ